MSTNTGNTTTTADLMPKKWSKGGVTNAWLDSVPGPDGLRAWWGRLKTYGADNMTRNDVFEVARKIAAYSEDTPLTRREVVTLVDYELYQLWS